MMLRPLSMFISLPLSNKVLALRHLYWRLKSRFFYRFMFKAFGRGSCLYRPTFICNADCIEIGEYVSIRDGIRLEAVRDPFGRVPQLSIGSNTGIEQDVHIVCHSRVRIGQDVSITARCAIVDVTHPYDDINVVNIGKGVADEDSFVEICDGVFLGYGSVILPNVRIGRHAVIGANSVVTQDIPDFSIAAGVPARVIKSYSHELQQWICAPST